MKKYLELSIILIAGLLVSCAGEGYNGHQGPGGWMPPQKKDKRRPHIVNHLGQHLTIYASAACTHPD